MCIEGLTNAPERCKGGAVACKTGVPLLSQLQEVALQCVRSCLLHDEGR